jgi:hypothetical protein
LKRKNKNVQKLFEDRLQGFYQAQKYDPDKRLWTGNWHGSLHFASSVGSG